MANANAGVVLVKEPQFDKIAAKAVLERHLEMFLPVAQYWESNQEPDEATMASWMDRNLVPIDIGHDKYHSRGTSSALESIVIDYNIKRTPALAKLLEMVGKNNQTGYLKGAPGSIVWILREMYKLGCDPWEVVEAVTLVVKDFLDAFAEKSMDDETSKLSSLMADMGPEVAKGNFAPFTISRYARDMHRLGITDAVILPRCNFFYKAWKQAKENLEEASQEPPAKEFRISTRRCAFAESDNSFATRELLKRYSLIIIRNSKDHVAIQTRGGNFSRLANELRQREPSKWFYDPRLPVMLNGSRQCLAVEPTSIPDGELINLVQRLVSF